MNVNEMKEMLDRHDGYMRVTIGGMEYDGGAIRLDRNGRVSIELNPRVASGFEKLECAIEDIEESASEARRAIQSLKP